ncbi:hypothetical protein JW851_00645 [Candidatus Woesearchaeota archaeon]|nr:hypothetical protein [Candidatus Woesearchaeota archaeon]
MSQDKEEWKLIDFDELVIFRGLFEPIEFCKFALDDSISSIKIGRIKKADDWNYIKNEFMKYRIPPETNALYIGRNTFWNPSQWHFLPYKLPKSLYELYHKDRLKVK